MTSRLQARLLAQRALFQRLQSSKKRSKLQAGFTLIELLIVVVIIGILSAIAIPNFLGAREKAIQGAQKAAVSGDARSCSAAKVAGSLNTWTAAGTNGTCTTGVDTFTSGGQSATVSSDGAVSVNFTN